MKKIFVLGVVAFLLSACSLSGPIRDDPRAKGYGFENPENPWAPHDAKNVADFVFENPKNGAQILLNSVCDRYPDSSLESLSRELMVPFQRAEIQSQQEGYIDGRRSLHSFVRGAIDGVPVEGFLVVVRKNRCIFDFTLLARHKLASEDRDSFDKILKSFKYQSTLGDSKTEIPIDRQLGSTP